jgi:hypothetical protein
LKLNYTLLPFQNEVHDVFQPYSFIFNQLQHIGQIVNHIYTVKHLMKKQRTLIFFIQMSPFKKKKEMGNKAQFSA